MGNTLWSKLNNMSKSKKNSYELSKKTNIPEEKVKEILNGDREVPTDRVDTLVSAIKEDNKVEKSLNIESIKRWIQETDLKERRLEYNYKTQGELAKELGVHTSVVSRLESKNTSQASDALLMRYYDFLNDGLNKKIIKPAPGTYNQTLRLKENSELINDINLKELDAWYRDFDFKKYLEEINMTSREFAITLGYKPSSVSLIYALINHKVDTEGRGSVVISRAYLYITGKHTDFEPTKEIETPTETTDDYVRVEEPVNEPVEEEVNTEVATTYPNENVVVSINKTDTVAPETITIPKYQYEDLIEQTKYLTTRVELLETQVERYEKLIDLIERR